MDLSFPLNHGVDDGTRVCISHDLLSISYATVDDAMDCIRKLGVGTQLVKFDLKSVYRIVEVHPEDQHLLAITWEDGIYVDYALPFGLRSASKIFTAVADMITWALHCSILHH